MRHEQQPLSYREQRDAKRLIESADEGLGVALKPTDGWDTNPRPSPLNEVEQHSRQEVDQKFVPLGHISLQGDFEQKDSSEYTYVSKSNWDDVTASGFRAYRNVRIYAADSSKDAHVYNEYSKRQFTSAVKQYGPENVIIGEPFVINDNDAIEITEGTTPDNFGIYIRDSEPIQE